MTRRLQRLHLDPGSEHSDSDEEPEKDIAYWAARLGGEEHLSKELRASIRESVTQKICRKLALDIMTSLGFEDEDFIQTVLASVPSEPDTRVHLVLSVGDNFHLDDMLSDEMLARIKEEFEFDCDAGWFMDSLDTSWVRCA